jgi:hypothetical protein
VAVCQYSPQGSAASLLTFHTLSVMSDKALGAVWESQLIWLICACETKKIGWFDAEAS